jgi:hypothetical protein
MNWSLTRLITASAFVAALGLGAAQANAQKATFYLPFEAHWGRAVLHAGKYTLTTPESASDSRIFFLQSASGSQMALPIIVGNGVVSKRSYLKLVNVGGTFYVQEYVSAPTGIALKFATPKASHRDLSAQARVLVTSD